MMNSAHSTKTILIMALAFSAPQFTVSAQTETATEAPNASFKELLKEYRELEAKAKAEAQPKPKPKVPASPLPPMPEAPATKSAPVFPLDDGEPREFPWNGKRATTAFNYTDGAVHHKLSKFTCPDNTVADFKLDGIYQYSSVGENIGCSYNTKTGKGFASAFANAVTSPTDAQDRVDGFASGLKEKDKSAFVISTEPVTISFGSQKVNCPSATLGITNQKAGDRDTILACQFDGWTFRFRTIWNSTDEPNKTRAVVDKIASAQTEAVNHLVKCRNFRMQIADMKRSDITNLTYRAEGFAYQEKGDACYAGHSKQGALARLIRLWPENPDTPITHDYVSHNGQFQAKPAFRVQDMWARADAADRGESGYLMVQAQSNGALIFYGGYNRIPNEGSFYGDVTQAIEGTKKPTLLATQNEGGGWDMTPQ